jgi:hypothetical protein
MEPFVEDALSVDDAWRAAGRYRLIATPERVVFMPLDPDGLGGDELLPDHDVIPRLLSALEAGLAVDIRP